MASPNLPAVSDSSAHSDGSPGETGAPGASRGRALEGGAGRPLSNRNLGILCSDPQRPEALLLQRVVAGLGARTALVRPSLDEDAPSFVEHTARVLGLLYDAIICVDLAPHSVDRLRECARIPVLANLTLPEDPDAGQSAEAVSELGRQILARLAGASV